MAAPALRGLSLRAALRLRAPCARLQPPSCSLARRVGVPPPPPARWASARAGAPRRASSAAPMPALGGGGGRGPLPPRSGGGGGGSSGGDSLPSGGPWGAYMAALEKNPLAVKALTAAALNLLGDLIGQLVFEKGPFSAKRAAIFAALGGLLVGPALHIWYGTLGRLVTATGAAGSVQKLLLDQFLFAPAFIALILATLTTAEGNAAQVMPKLRQDWAIVVTANWKLWIPFQFFNFRFVPPQLQVAAANVCALAWNVILSLLSHAKVAEAAPVKAVAAAKKR